MDVGVCAEGCAFFFSKYIILFLSFFLPSFFFQIYSPAPSDTARKWLTAFVPLPLHQYHQWSPENMGHYFCSGAGIVGLVIVDLSYSEVCQFS